MFWKYNVLNVALYNKKNNVNDELCMMCCFVTAADEAITMQKRLSDPGSQPTEDTSPAKKQKVLSDAENKVPLKEQATV